MGLGSEGAEWDSVCFHSVDFPRFGLLQDPEEESRVSLRGRKDFVAVGQIEVAVVKWVIGVLWY